MTLAAFCLLIGAYPLMYLLADGKIGLLQTKSDQLVNDAWWWRLGFYTHIVCGGVALSVGWSQFVKSWRERYLKWHRVIGKLYVLMVCVSGLAAIGISPQTSTGWIAGLGFGSLGVIWVFVTLQAYKSIRQRNVHRHQRMMVYSYSACFAAVTLRFWLPLLTGVIRLDFAVAYPIVAWLCWVPNLIVAYSINSRSLTNAPELLLRSPAVMGSTDKS
jgi:uncharacterized membrane protein